MSQYTTGEAARLCGVSVRTVQYYDTRGLLAPSAVSEGGRRLYSQEDIRKLRVICFLRSIGLPLGSIGEILEAEQFESVTGLLLDQQAELLQKEVEEKQVQLADLQTLRQELKGWKKPSVETLGDIACIMENKKKLRKVYAILIAVGLVMDAIEIGTLIYWIRTGVWQPFAVGMVLVIAMAMFAVRFFHRNTAYICPECHAVFKPAMKQFFFASHTPRTRKLTCTHCGYKGYCVETHAEALRIHS